MTGWRGPLAAMIVTALLVAAFGVQAVPGALMNVAISRLSAGGINQMSHGNLATPENQPVVRPSPDLAYSSCPFDLSAGPVMIDVHPLAGRYQSLSIFDAQTDVIFVRNDVQAGGKPYRVMLALEGQQTPTGVEVVRTAYPKGIALIRLLLSDPAELPMLLPERAKSVCGVFVAVSAK